MYNLSNYEFAFEISPVPMFLVSTHGVIMLTNRLLDQLFEYEPSELNGKNVEVLVPESIRGHHPELRGAYFKFPAKRNMGQGRDLFGITKSGKVIPLELGLDTVPIDGHLCALVVALDISQRKQHEQRMKLAMDAAASAMIMVNEEGVIEFVNKAALTLFGYEEHELLNTRIERLVPEEAQRIHPVYRESFMNASKARPMAKELELYALHRNGHKIPVEIALTPVATPGGKMVVSTVIDLSDQVSAELAMIKKNEELAMLNAELMQFAYSASHDLKAPLSSIIGLLDLCVEDLEDGETAQVLENLKKTREIGRRSAEKVENVLDIARVGFDEIQPTKIHLQAIIEEMWLDFSGRNSTEIELLVDLQHVDPVILELTTLKVIIENLLSNALRYFDHDKPVKTIEVATQSDDSCLRLVVSDNGIGIPKESQHAVFDMFKRIDDRSDNGLGLALVKKHIERLDGKIGFTSVEGQGTSFTVTLPLLELGSK